MSLLIPTAARNIPDISATLKLRDFIGSARVERFGLQHPLRAGFRAQQKLIRTGKLSGREWRALLDLDLSARAINFDLRPTAVVDVLRNDLCSTRRGRPLLFEAHVGEFILRPNVTRLGWRRYVEGKSDFLTAEPAIQVECKLLMERASVKRVIEKAFERVDQRSEGEGPFVLVAGCDDLIAAQDVRQVPELVQRFAEMWFDRHREVAAVVLVLPHAPEPLRASTHLYRHTDVQMRNGSVVVLKSSVSSAPLPAGFEFQIRET